jgi:hypothetical protein
MNFKSDSLFATLGAASWSTSKSTTSASEATSSALEHHLHHSSKLSYLGLVSSSASMAHARLVLSFLYNSDLTTLKQAFIVHLCLHD